MTQSPHGRPGGFLIAAPSSGAGKTTVTLGLLRALRNRGIRMSCAKSGPDYIDPKFHQAASGETCVNLDAFAMSKEQLHGLACCHAAQSDLLLVEGAMGLFDGAANGRGSSADLAASLGLSVLLVLDCARQSQSVAALLHGFASFREDVTIGGVVLNNVGSARHEVILREALAGSGIPVLGAVPRDPDLRLPDRHLGLVQAEEHSDLQAFLDRAAGLMEKSLDIPGLMEIAEPIAPAAARPEHLPVLLPPPGQHVAIARDVAFAFSYPHILSGWQAAGARLSFFSPVGDEPPEESADCIYLPGGYPELHAGRLAANNRFLAGVSQAAASGKPIYGECGGYMVLGEALIDAQGVAHEMLGLLPLKTSFETRRRYLGYRVVSPLQETWWFGQPGAVELMAHEFHYATIVDEAAGEPLFAATDALGGQLPDMGLKRGNVMGSFAHLIAAKQ